MAAKHTPGPWFVVEGSLNGAWPHGCEIAIDDVDGGNPERDYFLASVVHGDPDELLANARLVAAAPRLYAELAELRERFVKALIHAGTDPEYAAFAVAGADAALSAAATGDQQ